MKRQLTICSLAMGLMWGHNASAQPINYGSKNTTPQEPARPKDRDEYADEVKARWTQLKQEFKERTREKDPFGSNMYPGMLKEPAISMAQLVEPIPAEPIKVIPLPDVVKKFQPNLISATQQLVMIAGRTLRVGDPVQIECQGVLFKLRIIRIATDEVELINTENGQKAIARDDVFDPKSLDEDADDLLNRISGDEKPLIIK